MTVPSGRASLRRGSLPRLHSARSPAGGENSTVRRDGTIGAGDRYHRWFGSECRCRRVGGPLLLGTAAIPLVGTAARLSFPPELRTALPGARRGAVNLPQDGSPLACKFFYELMLTPRETFTRRTGRYRTGTSGTAVFFITAALPGHRLIFTARGEYTAARQNAGDIRAWWQKNMVRHRCVWPSFRRLAELARTDGTLRNVILLQIRTLLVCIRQQAALTRALSSVSGFPLNLRRRRFAVACGWER